MHREPHDIVKAAVDTAYAYGAYPLLYSVGPRLVERMVMAHIFLDFIVGNGSEFDGRQCFKTGRFPAGEDRDAGHYLMAAPAEAAQHPDSFGFVAGFTEHLTSDNDNGVGGDIQIVVEGR